MFSELIKYHANIDVLAIINHRWMYGFVPANTTHRIYVSFTKNGIDYDWDQVYNEKVISLQDMLKRAIRAIGRAGA